jgi:hypothetical protein
MSVGDYDDRLSQSMRQSKLPISTIARRYEQQLCAWDHAIQETL